MIYEREYKGFNIQIEGGWSEENQSNLYRWRIVSSKQAINLEGKQPFRGWEECWIDACVAIDQYAGGLT